ncbi:MAG: TrkA family potassium uptake protein [Chloroflexi bacterium]|nr:TrkA family potassium uptake protein [Chloroflexota bacterium]
MPQLRVLIVGAGKLGRQTAKLLINAGNHVILVDKDPAALHEMKDILGDGAVSGDGCEPTVLEKAGIGQAQVVIAATGHDEDNLVVAELARRIFDVPRVIARVNRPENEWLFTPQRGVDVAFSPATLVAKMVEEVVDRGASPS